MIVRSHKIIAVLFLLFLGCFTMHAQEEEDSNLGTEVVNVVKPYTPTISNAFKVKATPKLNDSINTVKKVVTYSIFSVPVASTFTPAKGKAATVKKAPKVKLYDNYATLGFGSFTSILAEFYSNIQISRTENFGIFLNHNSSQGGIDGTVVDDYFYDTRLNLNYGARERDYAWRTDLDFKHQVFNWYGISPQLTEIAVADSPLFTDAFDPSHTYFTAGINGNLSFKDAIFKDGNATLRYFGDSEGSSEIRFLAAPTVEFPIAGENVTTTATLDYVSGSFENGFSTEDGEIKHSILNVGLSPSLEILRDDLTVNLGLSAFVSLDGENSNTNFFAYPKVTASYRVAGEYFIAYAGLEGDLQQNSYHDFAQENPFISPTLVVVPTDNQYDGYLGMKGKLSNSTSYNLRANYSKANNRALFKYNRFAPGVTTIDAENGYNNQNSFNVVYDDVTIFGVFGELNFDVNNNFKMKVNAQFNSYDTENQIEAWNLPDIQASVFGDYQITQNWFAGVNVFFVGERKDEQLVAQTGAIGFTEETVTLDSYFDANFHLGYRFNDRLSAFGRVNNVFSNNYEKWLNYPVQGLQALVGATYKFDF